MADMQPQMMPQQQPQAPTQPMYSPYSFYQPTSYNPMFNYQQRLQNMEQQFPHLVPNNYQQQNSQVQQQQSQMTALKGKAVTGIDEAKASSIDFDGSVHFFTDLANGNIYTKQIGLNGAAEFNIYKLQPKEVEKPPEATIAALLL